jgi:hypothetical protein
MKKKYIQPLAETVNIRLNSSTLDSIGMTGDSEYANTWDANGQQFDVEDDASSDLPKYKSLWD